MFSDIPKLFDRNYLIAYLLPTGIFMAVSYQILIVFDLLDKLLPNLEADLLIGTTMIGLIGIAITFVLTILNREIVRIAEGYGPLQKIDWLVKREQAKFDKLCTTIKKLENEYNNQQTHSKLAREKRRLATHFPDQRRHVLPMAFGNVVRAHEVYPRVMYGLEGVNGWNRLVAVLPKEYLEEVNTAKSHVDFWINIWFFSWLVLFEYTVTTLLTASSIYLWVLLAILSIAWLAIQFAKGASIEHGDIVKAAYDVFVPILYERLQIEMPESVEERRKIMTTFSQAIIYRVPTSLPDINQNKHNNLNEAEET